MSRGSRLSSTVRRLGGPDRHDDRLCAKRWACGEARRCPTCSRADFLEDEAARLEQLRLVAVEDRIAAELDDGCHGRLVAELETLVDANPLREQLWQQLIVALYRCGRQAEALRACRAVRACSREEVGVEPGHELRDVEAAVLAQDRSWTGGRASPSAGTRPRPTPAARIQRRATARAVRQGPRRDQPRLPGRRRRTNPT